MKYIVIEVSDKCVTIWDGISKDKHLQPAGVMEIAVEPPHTYKVGDRVHLSIRLVESTTEQEKEDGSGDS